MKRETRVFTKHESLTNTMMLQAVSNSEVKIHVENNISLYLII